MACQFHFQMQLWKEGERKLWLEGENLGGGRNQWAHSIPGSSPHELWLPVRMLLVGGKRKLWPSWFKPLGILVSHKTRAPKVGWPPGAPGPVFPVLFHYWLHSILGDQFFLNVPFNLKKKINVGSLSIPPIKSFSYISLAWSVQTSIPNTTIGKWNGTTMTTLMKPTTF